MGNMPKTQVRTIKTESSGTNSKREPSSVQDGPAKEPLCYETLEICRTVWRKKRREGDFRNEGGGGKE